MLASLPASCHRAQSESFTFDYVYSPEASSADIFERTLRALLSNFVDGYNVAVVAFGASRSGKSYCLEGAGRDARDSLIVMAISELMPQLQERLDGGGARRRGGRYSYTLTVQYVEIIDEQLYDLLNSQNNTVEVDDYAAVSTLPFKNLTKRFDELQQPPSPPQLSCFGGRACFILPPGPGQPHNRPQRVRPPLAPIVSPLLPRAVAAVRGHLRRSRSRPLPLTDDSAHLSLPFC